ncbi:HD domain protein [uncultured archaeon]|nr:HD domain protein [uncultured archaeon]
MWINDRLYGRSEVKDEVLVELMRSGPMQRLKWVTQTGIPVKVAHHRTYSRYEHSVGVMLLLRKFGASQEEQIAGLLHDVSHTAFSHVIDWVMGNPKEENYQDSVLAEHIGRDPIKGILKRHGFDVKTVSELEHNGKYRLLERDLPDLCADRLDYAMRDTTYWLNADVKPCLNGLVVRDNEFMFDSVTAARKFGNYYMKCQKGYWGSPEWKVRYHLLSNALKIAMDKKIIGMDDLYRKEQEIIKKVRVEGDNEEIRLMNLALGNVKYMVCEDGDIVLTKKKRYIDPKFIDRSGKVMRLSQVDAKFKELIRSERSARKEDRARIISR